MTFDKPAPSVNEIGNNHAILKNDGVMLDLTSKLFFLFCFLFVLTRTQAQFFTKTTNSIPRLGRSDQSLLPNLVRHVAKQLHFVIKMINENDKDGNGELNAEELMDAPFIQNVMKSELEAIELRGQYLATNGKAERESESSGKQRLIYDENLIM
ncbi:uncharacterized protein CDAR_388691 [Caerostris darwini]|uniref:EF-hand domain-containing protein n=1 Tax=Caerostris darwini TaxID=1538125 RepID=A0AAV4S477_9ARAC|nr:uncharacterized protein CDAR_388691 [Caerostris darwini]